LAQARTIVEIKKCANVRERPFDMAGPLAIAEYRYNVSARHYLDGFRHLYRFAAEGRVFGACPHGAVGFGRADRGDRRYCLSSG